jgi:hypothetical protein
MKEIEVFEKLKKVFAFRVGRLSNQDQISKKKTRSIGKRKGKRPACA